MTGFSAGWLALREPFDRAARAEPAVAQGLAGLAAQLRGDASVLEVIDLACGTGANLRELAPRLGGPQRWLLVDHDPALLAALPEVFASWSQAEGHTMRVTEGKLRIEGTGWSADVESLRADLVGALDTVPFARARLVTASALLDLVSAAWLDALCVRARTAGAAVLFALNVDGRIDWQPAVDGDDEVHRLFAGHQRRDKGFGRALGDDATDVTLARLDALGYRASRAPCDWHIDGREGPQAVSMLAALIEGMAAAALEQDPTASHVIGEWKSRRLAAIDGSRLRIGHQQILATLPWPLTASSVA